MLFAYGTLQDRDILGAVLGRRRRSHHPAGSGSWFGGDCLSCPSLSGLVPAPSAATQGMLIGVLSAQDWAALDAFEGDEYRRASLR
ncbi:MAG TPA: gamma-glutamylcyclotransferase family protein [Devosia sp.]|jgi:hypothetical protein